MPSSRRGPHSVQHPIFLHAISAAVSCCLLSALAVHASINITLGSKLVNGDLTGWVSSPNQSFRLAFYPNPAANSNTFSIGVLYNAPAINTTVAWSPGGNIQVGSSGSLELSEDGELILRNSSGTIVWRNGTAASKKVAAATMRDDGNFVLSDASGDSIWQSFDTPTDTLVFGQQLPQGKSLTAGEYTASIQATGKLTLSYTGNGGYTYWSSGANGSAYAVLESPGKLSLYDKQHKALMQWYSNDYTSTSQQAPIRRVTLDSFGRLRIYTWSAGSSSPDWTVGWEALEDHCRIYAYCGPNGICSYNETGVICTCASGAGYDFKDRKNPNSGCIPIAGNGGTNCSGATMVDLNNTVLFVPPTLVQTFSYGDAECSQYCLGNEVCQAATALSDGSGSCQISVSAFYSGYQEVSISTHSYIRYCGSNVPPAGMTRSDTLLLGPALAPVVQKKPVVVPLIVSVLVTVVVLAFLQGCVWWMCCRKNPRWGGYSAQYALMEYASGAPVQLSYKELRRATGNFKEKLGQGGFGAVYKGELLATGDAAGQGTATEVAVKRLEGLAHHGEHQFRMEMSVIGSTHHMNLVRLCGFCAEGKERLLVYEYMRNGSLDKYLFAGGEAGAARSGGVPAGGASGSVIGRRSDMDWDTRFSVLLGTARGITYLHQECHDCIIHSDIKPENILLDNNFTAKVSDFGLAKLTRAHQGRHVTILVRGTRGYMAPEWRSNIPISVKADVFSFGMVVLETISGRRSFDPSVPAASVRRITFPEWAYRQYFNHMQVESVVDERIRDEVDMEQLDRAMKVAFWCLQVQPSMRPSMSKVIQMLDGSMAHPLPVPPMPKSFGDPSSSAVELEDSSLVTIETPSEPDQSSSAPSTAFSSATAARSTTTSIPPSWFQSDHSSVVEPEDASLIRTAAACEPDQSSSTPPTGLSSPPAASATMSTLPSWFQTDLMRSGAVQSQSVVSHQNARPLRPRRNDLLSL